MKSILFFILFFSIVLSYGQSQPDPQRVKQAVSAIEKGECILIFYDEHFASDFEKKQIKELEVISQLDFKVLDSLFNKNNNPKIQITVFYVLCQKHREFIREEHLNKLNKNDELTFCSGRDTQKASLSQLSNYLYKNSVERKEKIINPKAFKLLKEAQELNYKGPVDFEKMISILNEANQLEPNNPIILDALGEAKFNSKIDIEGALIDFQNAITYSLDQLSLEMRYHNRGIRFMEMEDIESACEDWRKAGESGLSYLEQYCSQPFDKTIYENPDDALKLTLSLLDDTAFITSSHNIAAMSDCYVKLVIENNNLPKITVKDGSISLCLESSKSELYLEAISEDGKKFHFFTEKEFFFYGNGKDILIEPKGIFSKEINLTESHHFPNSGTYKIRIAIRQTKNMDGIDKTYYSNWINLVIVKNYQRDLDHWTDFEK